MGKSPKNLVRAGKTPYGKMKPSRKLSRNKPKYTAMSTVPLINFTKETLKDYERLLEMPGRVNDGLKYFLLDVANMLREEVRAKAPLISGVDYAKKLRIGILPGIDDDEAAVAVFFKGELSPIKEEEKERVLLFVIPGREAPKYAYVLRAYGPWPADLLPVRPQKDTDILARYARMDEIMFYRRKIIAKKSEIEQKLSAAGASGVKIKTTDQNVGLEVHHDIGHTILRREFGYEGEAKPHWRPALKALKQRIPDALARFEKYIDTGNVNVFNIPKIDHISQKEFLRGKKFQDTLAPYAPKM